MKTLIFEKLLQFLNRLEQEKIYYTLSHHRENAIMITVSLPGERWEIEFLEDGSVEVEQFKSHGEIYDENCLNDLFTHFCDSSQPFYCKPKLAAAVG
ncbi:MAG: hypothetical protein B6247_31530 [Candidatus Parabeggiatoa sp. nov. 2]|nr:MAG: hypothetical protein B6247_31530 [Beggiatoa sp. 4572_84]